MTIRVCVIGAGPSGMSTLAMFKKLQGEGDVCEITCFEKQDASGGLWNLTWRTGLDEYGQPVHCSMYKGLFSNAPKECLEFPEYTFLDHFGKDLPSCPPRMVLCDYLKGYWKFLGVKDEDVYLGHSVNSVNYNDATKTFKVGVKNLANNQEFYQEFDRVVVATGHFSTPHVPSFPGLETFQGRVLHAHDFRNAQEFQGQKCLLIGSSYSAEDIGLQLYKFGAAHVTMSYRTKPMGFSWPDNMEEVPLLVKVEGKMCYFKDGHADEFDVIIMCTGYQHYFPFMEPELRLSTSNLFNLPNLYRNLQWYGSSTGAKDADGRLFYIGMTNQVYTFTMFMMQGLWITQVIKGIHKTPNPEDCVVSIADKLAENDGLTDAEKMIDNQTEYMRLLRQDTEYETSMEGCAAMFKCWAHDKNENIVTYRDKPHKNLFTGFSSPVCKKPWMDCLDDSLEGYLEYSV